ncbi:hypothetical protein QOT17_023398 [Balamuthia mandrillaris]
MLASCNMNSFHKRKIYKMMWTRKNKERRNALIMLAVINITSSPLCKVFVCFSNTDDGPKVIRGSNPGVFIFIIAQDYRNYWTLHHGPRPFTS